MSVRIGGEAFEMLLARQEPAHIVRIHGIEYAYIFRVEGPLARR